MIYRLLARGETTAAQTLFSRFNQWALEMGRPEKSLASYFLSLGKHFRSRTLWEYLLILDPENPDALQELQRLDAPDPGAA